MTLLSRKGFTLVEVLITLVVAAILLGLATPTITTLTRNKMITTQANELVSSLALARSEALKRVSRVTVCKSADGSSCTNTGSWDQGWIVFNDSDNDAQVGSSTGVGTSQQIIKVYSALDGGNTLTGSTNVANYVSYVSSGHSKLIDGTFQAGSLVLCDDRGAGEHAREITVNITGRVRVESDAPASCAP